MSETAPDGLVATFKGGKGYDAPWLVIHAPDPVQFQHRLNIINDEMLHQLSQISARFQAIVAVEEKLGPTTLAGSSSTQAAVPSTAPAPAQSAPLPHDQQSSNVVPFQQPAPAQGKQLSPNGTSCSKCSEQLYWQEWEAKGGKSAGKRVGAYKCGGRGLGHDMDGYKVLG
jgi:hypothetical protein